MHGSMHVCMYVYMRARMYVCMYACMYVCAYAIHACVYVSACTCDCTMTVPHYVSLWSLCCHDAESVNHCIQQFDGMGTIVSGWTDHHRTVTPHSCVNDGTHDRGCGRHTVFTDDVPGTVGYVTPHISHTVADCRRCTTKQYTTACIRLHS